MTSSPKPVYIVSVRELVEFVLRRGNLGGDRDFVGSDRALAGTRGHQKVQRSRPAGYQKEVRLSYDIITEAFILRIQGRLDGVLTGPSETVLEEIKTTQGSWDGVADPLHWAQAKFYGFVYAGNNSLGHVVIQLTYFCLETGKETIFRLPQSFAELREFFESATGVYLEWIRDRHESSKTRDESIARLSFPFQRYRSGQRQLAVAAYRALVKGGSLFLEAPTGIGKTMSVLFPAIKALGEGKLERIFYLTARTVGRGIAEQAIAEMRRAGLRLRALTLTAKEKMCVRDGSRCDTTTCPLAVGYFDRRHAAMRAALAHEEITRPVLETVAANHQVCPFELSLDLSTWVDAVICDYNYVFDPKVYLRRHFAEEPTDCAFLVDEAHNLVDRAREMFSADLVIDEIQEVRRALKNVPRCARALSKLAAALRKLAGQGEEQTLGKRLPGDAAGELSLYPAAPREAVFNPRLPERDAQTSVYRQFPAELTPLLENALKQAEAWLVRNQPAEFREALLGLYFRLHSFLRTAETYDERFVTIVDSAPRVRVRLFCLDPSHLLRQALARGKAAVFFSATLRPRDYYGSLLGGNSDSKSLQLRSPFPPENLAVLVHTRIQTHLNAREASLDDVAKSIDALIRQRRGNYLVYFPSFKYLESVLERFRTLNTTAEIISQRPSMSEPDRESFLAAFRSERPETLIGFAVMGGVFGEGIDLVGERLIGAVIVGVGLPQLSTERDLVREYFQARAVDGFSYAYVFPGMNRVLQAVGRVIRCESDRGVVLLMDQRFRESRYRQLAPEWWQVQAVSNDAEIARAAAAFWAR